MELSPSPCFATRRATITKELPAPETPAEQEVVEQIEDLWVGSVHGSLNVPIFHITQPLDSIRYMVYNGYYKVMSNIPKMGHLTTPGVRAAT